MRWRWQATYQDPRCLLEVRTCLFRWIWMGSFWRLSSAWPETALRSVSNIRFPVFPPIFPAAGRLHHSTNIKFRLSAPTFVGGTRTATMVILYPSVTRTICISPWIRIGIRRTTKSDWRMARVGWVFSVVFLWDGDESEPHLQLNSRKD